MAAELSATFSNVNLTPDLGNRQDETILRYQGQSILWLMDTSKDYTDTMTFNEPKVFGHNDPLKFSSGCINLRVKESKWSKAFPTDLIIENVNITHYENDETTYVKVQLQYDPPTPIGLWRPDFHRYKYVNLDISLREPFGNWIPIKPSLTKTVWPAIAECACGKKILHAEGPLCAFSNLKKFIQQQYWIDSRNQTQDLLTNYQYFLDSTLTLTFSMKQEERSEIKIERICTSSQKEYGKRLLFGELYADFTLKTSDGKSIPCHKNVLSGHSEVLTAMLQSSLIEKETQEWITDDMNSKVAFAFLKFLYYGDVEDAQMDVSLAFELLRTGHKYMIKPLESACREILLSFDVKKYDASTAFKMFAFCGNVEYLKDLRGIAVKVFQKNAPKFEASGELESLLVTYPRISAQLLAKLVENFTLEIHGKKL